MEIEETVKTLTNLQLTELKDLYEQQKKSEQGLGEKIITYIDDGAEINTRNVEDVIAAIKRKMI